MDRRVVDLTAGLGVAPSVETTVNSLDVVTPKSFLADRLGDA